MVYAEFIGFAAGTLTTAALVPQVIKSWKTRHTKDISLGWISTLTLGAFLWIAYGYLIASYPLIAANVVTFFLSATILGLKMRHG